MALALASGDPAAARCPLNLYRPPAPTPRPQPLGAFALVRALHHNPLECWAAEHFERPIVHVPLPIGHAVLVHEPAAIRHVLLDNAANYRKDALQRRVLSAGLSEGLLSAEGEQWHVQRRTLAPMFARRSVMSFAPAMMDAAQALATRWARQTDGATIDVAAEVTRLTLDVLERTIFSDGLGRDAEQFRLAMTAYFNSIGRISPLDLMGVPDFVPRMARLRVRSSLNFFEAAIDTMIATRRARLAAQPTSVPKDILTLLLDALDPETGERMTAQEVRSNILTFIAAGHETTANALAWSLFLLSQSPQWRERVEAEVDREIGSPPLAGEGHVGGLADRLTVTRAVIEEAIRLYPPIAAISRVAIGDDTLGSEPLRRGSLVVIAPYVLHRHRLLWDDPDDFDPGRFLGEARKNIDRFAYLPFGAGPRTCIGSAFALQEATLVLAVIMSRFSLTLAPRHAVWPLLRVTLRPAGGLPMTVRLRAAPTAPAAR
jgi:cytochrome P450